MDSDQENVGRWIEGAKLSNLLASDAGLLLIDCRYPYEYEGGHIKGAVNAPVWPSLCRKLFDCKYARVDILVVFYCEFSSARAPRMHDLVRNYDRGMNYKHYPKLQYPQLRILEGGYHKFHKEHKHLCQSDGDGSIYTKMRSNGKEMTSWWRRCKEMNRPPHTLALREFSKQSPSAYDRFITHSPS
ncbi:hypothetical protein Ciccas_005531 [Cichlidogyrus casuarinus]|uniref:protein-tyrosine-phosphatase n=1 Tax=Cichlidogyrus casuarinus TaxID=1844966 RepID=A0ABD2Q8L4_9PLAT